MVRSCMSVNLGTSPGAVLDIGYEEVAAPGFPASA
jgi:hypothetical protein